MQERIKQQHYFSKYVKEFIIEKSREKKSNAYH